MVKRDSNNILLGSIVVVAPDNTSASLMKSTLTNFGLADTECVLPKDLKQDTEPFFSNSIRILLIASETALSNELLKITRKVIENGGWAGVWCSPSAASLKPNDAWLTEQLLMQCGACLSENLDALSAAARFKTLTTMLKTTTIGVKGKSNAVTVRLATALELQGFKISNSQMPITLKIEDTGQIFAQSKQQSFLLGEPTAAALALKLAYRFQFEEAVADIPIRVNQKDIALVVQPPPRLLSEPASKKLFAAFGMAIPEEHLCQSPSESVRNVTSRIGMSVLKLAKPRLENKQNLGAVIKNIAGASAARRASQILDSLGKSLGPPPSLGILVSEQIEGGLRVWLKMKIHPVIGRIVVCGKGDIPDTQPITAFTVPVTASEVLRAFAYAEIDADTQSLQKIARAVCKFGKVVNDLSDRINRAEIHPLVATDAGSEALVLDALVSIGATDT